MDTEGKPMTHQNLIWLSLLLLILAGCATINTEELRCCNHCISYGETNLSKDCYTINKEHGGDKHCFLTFTDTPKTLAECQQLAQQAS